VRIVTEDEAPVARPQGHHREGSIQFQMYFAGSDGSPGFYTVANTSFESYYTPRHRHNYDQIRFCLRGDLNYGRDKFVPEGWVGYFPEGTFYGPQNIQCSWEESPEVLTHQFGGASLQGFLSGRHLLPAYDELASAGRFEQGTYVWTEADGTERRQDGYEAAWAAATGQELVYPPGRYHEPVLMDPSAHRWRPTMVAGVSEKVLGVFGECETRIAFVRLEGGASFPFGGRNADVTLFSMDGPMRIDGADYMPRTGVQILAGETIEVTTANGCEIYVVHLPDLTRVQSVA
jgi:hypothetical protein